MSGERAPRFGALFVQADEDPEPEILWQAGLETRRIHLVDTDGTDLPGWPKAFSFGSQSKSGCGFGDIDGDGKGEIVGLSDTSPANVRGWVWAWHVDGSLLSGFPVVTNGDFWGPPTVDDLDGDGRAEIIVSEARWPNGKLYAISGTGTVLPGWPVDLGDVPASSAATADLDNDGIREILFEAYNSFRAFHLDGTPVAGFPFRPPGGEQFSFASPVTADIDGDGYPEIAMGFEHTSPNYGGVFVLDRHGNMMPGWPQQTPYWVSAPPTFADIDRDGDVEIMVGDQVLGSPVNHVYAWHHDGTTVDGWPSPQMYAVFAQVTVADLDGNGDMELIWDDNTQFADGTGRLRGYHHNGTAIAGWPLHTVGSPFLNTPSVADVDLDGDLELLVACGSLLDPYTTIYLWNPVFRSFAPRPSNANHIEMSMYQYGPGHHGRYEGGGGIVSAPEPPETSTQLSLAVDANPIPADGTTIRFTAPSEGRIDIVVFDVEGRARRRIDVGQGAGGARVISFDARDDHGRPLPSGSYWIQLTIDGNQAVKRIVAIR